MHVRHAHRCRSTYRRRNRASIGQSDRGCRSLQSRVRRYPDRIGSGAGPTGNQALQGTPRADSHHWRVGRRLAQASVSVREMVTVPSSSASCDDDGAGFVIGQREDEPVRDASSVLLSLPARKTGTGGRKDDPSGSSIHSARARIEDFVVRIEFRRRRGFYAACCS